MMPVRLAGMALRLVRIQAVIWRFGLFELLGIVPVLRLITWLPGWKLLIRRQQPLACRLRLAMEALGPVFIKLGQMLATRRDLLPPQVADELARLQDRVPPFPGEQAQAMVSSMLGCPLEKVFARFDLMPLASASIAQVHGAVLQDGRDVVVKVLRPNLERIVRRDIDLLNLLAMLLERSGPQGRRLKPMAVVRDYEAILHAELDLAQEAANMSCMRRLFAGSEVFYVPEVIWTWTRSQCLVMERIHGVPLSDLALLDRQGFDREAVIRMGIEVFIKQIFRYNFFHADMHPGNLFVSRHADGQPYLIAVDFGIVGQLTERDRRYLGLNLMALYHRDYHRLATLHLSSGWVPAGTSVPAFEAAMRTMLEPVFSRPLQDISPAEMMMRLLETARRFEMEVQPRLILFQKTLFQLEGMARTMCPHMDLWAETRPWMERLAAEQFGPRALWKGMQDKLPAWMEVLAECPERMTTAIAALEALPGIEEALQRTSRTRGRLLLSGAQATASLALGACGAALWAFMQPETPWAWAILGGLLSVLLLASGYRALE
jgi:ubiquinone biosynthesis protein